MICQHVPTAEPEPRDWLMHKTPSLWRVHCVHHSDSSVDVTTYRQHPIEGILRFAFTMLPAIALELRPEAVALYRLLSASNALLEHMNVGVWQPLDTALSTLLVMPNMHKVHHSREPRETDSNDGNLFALFDRAFRTFTPTKRALEVHYGLDGPDKLERKPLGGLLRLPFRAATTPRAH